jgi:hypothetical protein
MFVALEYPLVDVRRFVDKETRRLVRPHWPLAEDGEFIRGIGSVKGRPRGGVAEWPGEDVFCDARRAISFWPPLRSVRVVIPDELDASFACAYRRFFSDGLTSRMAVGLRVENVRGVRRSHFLPVVDSALNLPVRVSRAGGRSQTQVRFAKARLYQTGDGLRQYLLHCTTERREGEVFVGDDWWIQSGAPLAIVVYRHDGEDSEVPGAQRVDVTEHPSLELAHKRVLIGNRASTIWFLGHDGTDRDTVRRLRIHLCRFHAERETLKQVLLLVARKKLSPGARSEASDALQVYLNDQVRLLGRPRRDGFNQGLFAEAYRWDALIHEGLRASLDAELEKARRNYSLNIRGAVDRASLTAQATTFNVDHVAELSVIQVAEGGTMQLGEGNVSQSGGGDQVAIGKVGRDVTGVVGVGNILTESLNRVENSQASPPLKEALRELTAAVEALTKELGQAETEEAVTRLQSFTNEATAPKPDRSILEAVGSALSKTAEAVATVGPPVVALVAKVLALI